MVQRAEKFMEMRRNYDELAFLVKEMLEELESNVKKGADETLVQFYLREKELDPENDVPNLQGLFERYNILTKDMEIAFDGFKTAKREAQKMLEGVPLVDAVLEPTSLSGKGEQNEEVFLRFEQDDVEISVFSEDYADDEEENMEYAEQQIRNEIEAWLLEELE